MKKFNKKIALILALALTLALAIPALAQQTEIVGSYKDDSSTEISVILYNGSSINAVLNKDGYPLNVYKNGPDSEVIATLNASGNITTWPIAGVNKGDSKVNVKATVTAVANGRFKFASSSPKDTAAGQSGYVVLEAKGISDEIIGENGLDIKKVADVLNGWTTAARTALKTDVNSRKNNVVVLKKGTVTSKGYVCSIDAGKNFVARLTGYISGGDTSKNHDKPEKEWASYDGFNATVVWSFETDG